MAKIMSYCTLQTTHRICWRTRFLLLMALSDKNRISTEVIWRVHVNKLISPTLSIKWRDSIESKRVSYHTSYMRLANIILLIRFFGSSNSTNCYSLLHWLVKFDVFLLLSTLSMYHWSRNRHKPTRNAWKMYLDRLY